MTATRRRRPARPAREEPVRSAEEAEPAPAADPESVARTIALNQLTAGPRTRAQLAEAMARRDVPEAIAEQVLDRFVEVGLIDDLEFSRSWVESRHDGRGLARRAIAQELRQKGVDQPDIDQALEGLDSERELQTARELVAKKLDSTRRFERQARFRRLTGMLARKGYPPGMCVQVVAEAMRNEGTEVHVVLDVTEDLYASSDDGTG
jgi:regulatory protein